VLLAGQRYVVRAEKILPTTKSSSQQCHRPPFILLSFSTDLEAAHFEFAFSNVWLWIEWIFYMLKDGLEAHVLDGWVGHEPHPEVAAGWSDDGWEVLATKSAWKMKMEKRVADRATATT
jgi:hypothetical protein